MFRVNGRGSNAYVQVTRNCYIPSKYFAFGSKLMQGDELNHDLLVSNLLGGSLTVVLPFVIELCHGHS